MARPFRSIVLLFVMLVWAHGSSSGAEAAPQASASTQVAPTAEGSLVIVGGGSVPKPVLDRFVELAGGREGRLVVIPTAGSDENGTEIIRRWIERGLGSVSVIHTRDRKEADSETFVQPLNKATAVWFQGGQQSRLADAYVGTATERAIVDLFRRGGVVGGTSAGAAIQSRVMIQSGDPIPKISTGLDLLPDAIIDQHFLHRNRFNRLLSAVLDHPECRGVGIDESTAIVFQRGECCVFGGSYVTIVTAKTGPASLSVHAFHAGQSFRLHELDQPAND